MKFETSKILKTLNSEGLIDVSGEQLIKLQQVLLEITDDIVKVCTENNLNWFLIGGSAIGAIRHQGFIPWDDDIDLGMPREDYEKFKVAFNDAFFDKYILQDPQDTDDYSILIPKVRLKNTVFRSRDDFEAKECGIFVDIFIVENVPNNKILRRIHGVSCMAADFLLSCRKFYRDRNYYLKLVKGNSEYTKVFQRKIRIGRLISFISMDGCRRFTDSLHSQCHNNQSEYVSIVADFGHYFGDMYKRADLCCTKKMVFEGRNWNVPVEIEQYLTHCYGDYMEIPKPEDREKHFLLELKLPEEK